MSDDPELPEIEWDEDVPESKPDDPGAEPEIHDQPMGVPADADEDEAPLPGMPETEPPSDG
jgi:hypothetical protein